MTSVDGDSARYAIGIDLGGTNLKAALVDDEALVIGRIEQPTRPERGPDAVMADMVELVDRLLSGVYTTAPMRREEMVGIGVGAPGPLSVKHGQIIRAANLPGWSEVSLRDTLAKNLGMRVELDNDGNAAALGEYWARGCKHDLVMLTLGTGVGAGVVLNGRLFHGHFENAGELGHMIVVPDGLHCNCGQRGCLEAYASASNVVRRVVEAVNAGGSSALSDAFARGEAVSASRVGECADAGDAVCEQIWDEACKMLAVACVNIQHTLNPAVIVLGGGMAAAGATLLDRVQRHFEMQRWALHDDYPSIELSRLGSDAGVVGAAALVMTAS